MTFLLLGHSFFAQVSSECANAIPICNNTPINAGTNGFGSDDFNGALSSGCLEQTASGTIESNSAWYRFRTNASGQLGFNIAHDVNEDWDFALYQSNDCHNLGNPIRCNFFDNSDQKAYTGVGMDPTGDVTSVNYEDWIYVDAGEDYILLVNNFSEVNSGFSIQFSGEIFDAHPFDALDCSIVSNLLGPPIAACDGTTVLLDATTAGALSYIWYADTGSGFQQISGETGTTLTAASNALYRVEVITFDTVIVSDVQVAFTVFPYTNPLMDETYCQSDLTGFDLSLKDLEALGTQYPDEYQVSYHHSQADADFAANPLPKLYENASGIEKIYVRTSSIANPNCYDTSQSFTLHNVEKPEITFEETISICDNGSGIWIGETIPDPHYTYLWNTGETSSSILVAQEGTYELVITHTLNGVACSTSSSVNVTTSASPQISTIEIDDLQSNNTVTVLTDVSGDFEYRLNDGAFQNSNVFKNVFSGMHTITMRDLKGCGMVSEDIVVVGFLRYFSPNGDGLNEDWHIEELHTLNDPVISIYDRYGKLIIQLNALSSGWDGTLEGKPMPATDYWFNLSYVDVNGNRTYAKFLQNHFSLRR
ncbi:MAG: T9SS type B sorting domain-containing protein [Bacteroidota bacterium]